MKQIWRWMSNTFTVLFLLGIFRYAVPLFGSGWILVVAVAIAVGGVMGYNTATKGYPFRFV